MAVALLMKRLISNPLTFSIEQARAEFPNIKDPQREVMRAARFLSDVFTKIEIKSAQFCDAYKYFDTIMKLSEFFS